VPHIVVVQVIDPIELQTPSETVFRGWFLEPKPFFRSTTGHFCTEAHPFIDGINMDNSPIGNRADRQD
jgi:hypothetical protein